MVSLQVAQRYGHVQILLLLIAVVEQFRTVHDSVQGTSCLQTSVDPKCEQDHTRATPGAHRRRNYPAGMVGCQLRLGMCYSDEHHLLGWVAQTSKSFRYEG